MDKPIGTIEQPRSLPITDIIRENDRVRTFFFTIELGSKPGQFVILWLPRIDEKPFSIAYDEHGKLGLSIAKVGPFTEELFKKKVGDLVGIRGPYGSWFFLKPEYKRILLIGGGYGVAPLAILAKQARDQGVAVDFCNGARSKNQILFTKRLADLNATVHYSTDDGTEGIKGTVIDTTTACLENNEYDCVYTCGPELMEKKVIDLCAAKNIPCQVSIERYMKCGFGICGQCCIDKSGERMCQEGPVVSGEYALQQPEFGSYHRGKSGKREYYKK